MDASITSGSSILPLDLVSIVLGREPTWGLVSWVGFRVVCEEVSVKACDDSCVLGENDVCMQSNDRTRWVTISVVNHRSRKITVSSNFATLQ